MLVPQGGRSAVFAVRFFLLLHEQSLTRQTTDHDYTSKHSVKSSACFCFAVARACRQPKKQHATAAPKNKLLVSVRCPEGAS